MKIVGAGREASRVDAVPVLAEVVRSGFVESRHRGSVVILGPAGDRLLAVGAVDSPVFSRSCVKPLQAAGMVRAGLDLPDDLLPLAGASHSGEPFHVEAVRRVLAGVGLTESALVCPAALPSSEAAAAAVLRGGGGPKPVTHNCSGKHAAMLATCVAAGWPTQGYADAGHPLQLALRAGVEELADERVAATGVDGCGAPVFAFSLVGLARAGARLTTATAGTPEHRVAATTRARPDLVGGTGRPVTDLMRGLPGLLTKDGAEGCWLAALPSGAAVALKIDDGAMRATVPVLLAALDRLGVDTTPVSELAATPVLGGGRPVGEVRALPLPPARPLPAG